MTITDTAPARTDFPVVVLGGGPAGLALALELSLHEIDVLVVEPRTAVEHGRPRAKTTSARTMELFRRWGVADDVRAAAALGVDWSDRVTFCSTVTGPEITHVDGVFGLDLGGSDLVAEAGQQVPQPVIEEVLRRRIEQLPSVTLLLGWRGVEIVDGVDRLTVTLEHAGGEHSVVDAGYLVGADGPRSVVRRHIGSRYVGAAGGRPNVNITFRSRELAGLIPHPPSIHYWVLNPAAPGVVGPLDLEGTWWAIATGVERVADQAEAAAIVGRLVGRPIDTDIIATDPWQARLLLADRYQRGRVFLVGDAAHQNPPWGGHGFNTGVGDAMNLGWKLGAVLNAWAPGALLDSYEAERRPVARQTIDVAAANMATLSTDLTDPALLGEGTDFEGARTRATNAIQRTKKAEFHSLGLVLGYGYTPAAARQTSTVSDYTPIAEPGLRLPHQHLADGRSLYDLLGPGLALLGAPEAVQPLAAAVQRRCVPCTVIDPARHQLTTTDLAPVVLVRPDQHIAWTGATLTTDQAENVLEQALLGFPRQ